MGTIKSFEELECWQEARRFVEQIYSFVKIKPFSSDFDLKRQLIRSSISVMANIAEGFHRNSDIDFIKFLDYSRSSLAESVSHLYVALDQKYINEEAFSQLKSKTDIIGKKINSLISYLKKTNKTSRTS